MLIIKMQGNSTYITDPSAPDQEPRKFAFDFSYWSHDGFKELENGYLSPVEPHYADQVRPSANPVCWCEKHTCQYVYNETCSALSKHLWHA